MAIIWWSNAKAICQSPEASQLLMTSASDISNGEFFFRIYQVEGASKKSGTDLNLSHACCLLFLMMSSGRVFLWGLARFFFLENLKQTIQIFEYMRLDSKKCRWFEHRVCASPPSRPMVMTETLHPPFVVQPPDWAANSCGLGAKTRISFYEYEPDSWWQSNSQSLIIGDEAL